YAASGALLRAVLPPLRPLSERLRLAVERWADEDAAEAVGDRALVARTIAKAALAHPPAPGPAGAFADSGVVQRVEALLGAPPGRNTVPGPPLCMGDGFVTSSLASVTLHLDHAAACVLPLLAARRPPPRRAGPWRARAGVRTRRSAGRVAAVRRGSSTHGVTACGTLPCGACGGGPGVGDYWVNIALVAVLILLNAVFAGSEIALISLREGQVRRLDRRGGAAARRLVRLAR